MLIIMAGRPYSGKTTFLNHLVPLLEARFEVSVWDPKMGLPDNINELSQAKRNELSIAAWETALDLCKEAAVDQPKVVHILDTCGANRNAIREVISTYVLQGHNTCIIEVESSPTTCAKRAKGDLELSVIESYDDKLQHSVPTFVDVCDEHIFIFNENDDSLANIKKAASEAHDKISEMLGILVNNG